MFSQNESVKILKSEEKVIIDGIIYYIHEVNKGETLYSISLAYNVPLKEITKENPDVIFGLMIGQVLKIPYVKETQNDDFILHPVEKGQTVYSLMKQYQIDTGVLYKYNPEVRRGLRYDYILKIPKPVVAAEETVEPEKEEFLIHKVRRKETLYSLSKKYKVTIKDIKNFNPELYAGPLKAGSTIKIPNPKKPAAILNLDFATFLDTSHYSRDSMILYNPEDFNCSNISKENLNKTINIAMILPFYIYENISINKNDTVNFGEEENHKNFNIYKKSLPFLEFYEGALLALDTLRKQGISVNLYTYSVENDTTMISKILNEISYMGIDLIVGPVHHRPVEKFVQFSTEKQIPIVLPFQRDYELLINNPNVFSVRPSKTADNELVADLISNYYNDNIILVRNKSFIDSITQTDFKKTLFKYLNEKTDIERVYLKEVIYDDTLQKSLEHSMSSSHNNLVYVNSTNEAFVSEIITKLNGLTLFYDITVVGDPFWQWYANIDVEYYYNLQLKYLTPFYVDYENIEVKKFLQKYRKVYFTEPMSFSYSFLGYDIIYYFTNALLNFGNSFPYCLQAMDLNLLHSNFMFYRINSKSGFENLGSNVYHYMPGLKIIKYPLTISTDSKWNNNIKAQ